MNDMDIGPGYFTVTEAGALAFYSSSKQPVIEAHMKPEQLMRLAQECVQAAQRLRATE